MTAASRAASQQDHIALPETVKLQQRSIASGCKWVENLLVHRAQGLDFGGTGERPQFGFYRKDMTIMADKSSFTADEWRQIVASPMLAGMAVTLADPSGLFGTIREGFSGAAALVAAKKDEGANAIARAIAADFDTAEGRTAARDGIKADMTGKTPEELKAQALEGLRKVSAILAAKAPGDAPAFRAWLTAIAANAAEAASEGGFLGFGGVKVSDAEKATLAEIDAALV